jgi:hypothetical protein
MRRVGTLLFLVGWAATGMVVGAVAMRGHWVPLPVPAAESAAPAATAEGEWHALHALLDGCGCSERVLAHLTRRVPVAGVRERVLWVTRDGDGPAATGFEMEPITAEQLAARHGLEAAPVLVVIDPNGTVRYRGGYTARKQGFAIRDREIIQETLSGAAPPPLPVYGCPVSDRFRERTSFLPP